MTAEAETHLHHDQLCHQFGKLEIRLEKTLFFSSLSQLLLGFIINSTVKRKGQHVLYTNAGTVETQRSVCSPKFFCFVFLSDKHWQIQEPFKWKSAPVHIKNVSFLSIFVHFSKVKQLPKTIIKIYIWETKQLTSVQSYSPVSTVSEGRIAMFLLVAV